jgi:gp16 family phage-associated protein
MSSRRPPRTLSAFLQDLQRQNKTVAAWARDKDLALHHVYMVLNGRTVGRHGKAREVLLAMGITPPPMFGPAQALQRQALRPRAPKVGT